MGVKILKSQASIKNINLKFKGLKDNDSLVMMDGLRMQQVLINLISNAINYSAREKTVKVSCKILAVEQNMLKFQVKVKDKGMGISEEDQKMIFTPFFRPIAELAQNASQTKPVSHGLGLYITKRIVESLGGTIEFKSALNVGTVFTLKFEVKKIRGNPLVSFQTLKGVQSKTKS